MTVPDRYVRPSVLALIGDAITRLAESYVLNATAPDELGRREADDVYREAVDALTLVAQRHPHLIAEAVAHLVDGMARTEAAQIVLAERSALRCLDRFETTPVDMRERRRP